jgi:formylglycine-generating enzyme required for sulfatase activity
MKLALVVLVACVLAGCKDDGEDAQGVSGAAGEGGAGTGGTNGGGGAGTGGTSGGGGTSSGGAAGTEGTGGGAGAPTTPASCEGLPDTCGPSGTAGCCASTVVPGGTFNRSNDPVSPATVSAFGLDVYEVTVGRFRKWVDGYPGNLPSNGAGKNPNDASDPGWNSAWNGDPEKFKATRTELIAALTCQPQFPTWTPDVADAENLPINCVTWYEAYAFCIWDGGRLPTEAEWNFAFVGGSDQRPYPWGSGIECAHATYDCYYTTCGDGVKGCAPTDIIAVGTKPAGNGKWGHAELAGNVWEWVLDWYEHSYPVPCIDCANHSPTGFRVYRGGGFGGAESTLSAYSRSDENPHLRSSAIGFRCARSP